MSGDVRGYLPGLIYRWRHMYERTQINHRDFTVNKGPCFNCTSCIVCGRGIWEDRCELWICQVTEWNYEHTVSFNFLLYVLTSTVAWCCAPNSLVTRADCVLEEGKVTMSPLSPRSNNAFRKPQPRTCIANRQFQPPFLKFTFFQVISPYLHRFDNVISKILAELEQMWTPPDRRP